MQRKTFIWLLLATLVLVLATGWALNAYRAGTSSTADRQALAPDWLQRQSAAAQVEIRSATDLTTLRLDGDRWRVVERHDYLADNSKVWNLIGQIARVQLVDTKTDNPKLHQRLGLRGLDQPAAQSRQLLVSDSSGAQLVDILVGKERLLVGKGARQYYLRRSGDNQTWVAEGRLELDLQPSAWLDRQLVDIDQSRIREVTINHPGKPLVTVNRAVPEDPMALQNIPAGRTPKTTEVTAIAYGLQDLPLQDVNKVEAADSDWDQAIGVTFSTFDGLQVLVELKQQDQGIVARLSAASDGEMADEAAALNARLNSWVFVIPLHTVTTFTRNLDELLEPAPKPVPAAE